jgi:pimeloyl-ACP methyl ester carboxylesterase
MIDISKINYPQLDRPTITHFLFHPRPEFGQPVSAAGDVPATIPVEPDVHLGVRFHLVEKTGVNILFFHGNGEIVADYDDFGQLINQLGINFLAVDYRGYGRSTGQPTVTAMMRDCHVVFDFTYGWLKENGFPGPVVAMGRSLGSACALELASQYADQIDALIVESGFARSAPLLRLLGVNTAEIGFKEDMGFQNADKIRKFHKPTLIIHAENDHIIPLSEGSLLHQTCPAADKTLLNIPNANHNDILMHGLQDYMSAIRRLAQQLGTPAAR